MSKYLKRKSYHIKQNTGSMLISFYWKRSCRRQSKPKLAALFATCACAFSIKEKGASAPAPVTLVASDTKKSDDTKKTSEA
jgi:hypothetical protein